MSLHNSPINFAIYVAESTVQNMQFSLEQSKLNNSHAVWGNQAKIFTKFLHLDLLGKYIVFVLNLTKDPSITELLGFPRWGKNNIKEFSQSSAKQIIYAKITSNIYSDDAPFWPDESAENVKYTLRFNFDVISTLESIDHIGDYINDEVVDAIRRSATNIGSIQTVNNTTIQPISTVEDFMNNTDKLRELVVNFKESLHNSQYVIAETDLIERFVSALLSKRFLILSGLAGSGKTKIAQYFAYWLLGKNSTAVGVIPVGADWVSNEQLFGYPDGLQSGVYVSKPVLNLVLHAIKNPNMPHILILDEMNLSHVERYFSDFLSAIESGEPIPLYEGAERFAAGEFVPRKLILPNNLFIIGTINVDETTYTFSPKVLDRANVIEFRMTVDMVKAYLQQQSMLDDQKLDSQGKMFQHHIVQWSSNIIQYFEMNNDWNTYYADAMLDLFTQMSSARIEFGYRVLSESHKLLSVMQHLAIQPDAHTFAHAFDCVVVQKLMPKLNGSGVTLKKLLTYLSELTVNNVSLPLTNSKAKRMLEKLNQDMYVSFAEA